MPLAEARAEARGSWASGSHRPARPGRSRSAPRRTLSSSATRSTRLSISSATPVGQATTASARGWRTLILASARAPRPTATASRDAAIAASSAGSRRSPGTGQSARWTLSGAEGSWSATSVPCISSATNGQKGATSSASVDRHSCRVAKAASPSADPSGPAPAAPEAAPRGAHVPVAEVVEEGLERAARAGGVEGLEALGHLRRRAVEARQDPAVHRAQRGGVGGGAARAPSRPAARRR